MNEFLIKTPQQLGAVLRGCRRERNLTQTDVGAKIGIPQKTVSRLESIPGTASLNMIFKLISALDLELVVRPRAARRRSEW